MGRTKDRKLSLQGSTMESPQARTGHDCKISNIDVLRDGAEQSEMWRIHSIMSRLIFREDFFICLDNYSVSSSSSLLAQQPCVCLGLFHGFITVNYSVMRAQGLHFVLPLISPTRSLRSRQHSSRGHWGAHISSPR
jgi:hypothetical protein